MADSNSDSLLTILHKRALPSFNQWLETHSDGTRGDGFDAFIALAERTHGVEPLPDMTPDEASFLRIWMGMQVAIIELSRIAAARGRSTPEILITLGRVLGAAAVYSSASALKDDAPMRQLAKMLIEEFRFAAKEAADQIEAAR